MIVCSFARIPSSNHWRITRHIASLALIFLGFSQAVAAGPTPPNPPDAQPLPPGIAVPAYKPQLRPFHPGQKLVYSASWVGIPAATATINLRDAAQNPDYWIAEATIRTNKVVDVLFKMRDYMREDFDPQTFAVRDLYIRQHENARLNEFQVDFDRTAHLVKAVKRNQKGTQSLNFHSDNPSAPITGALMALSQAMAPGKVLTFDVFSGRNRYVFQFTVVKRERISIPLGDFDAWRIIPRIVYLTNDDERKKANETFLWISADDRHLPLRLVATAFIGSVKADLVQVVDPHPAGHSVTGTTPDRSLSSAD
jgi:hypothetical protein